MGVCDRSSWPETAPRMAKICTPLHRSTCAALTGGHDGQGSTQALPPHRVCRRRHRRRARRRGRGAAQGACRGGGRRGCREAGGRQGLATRRRSTCCATTRPPASDRPPFRPGRIAPAAARSRSLHAAHAQIVVVRPGPGLFAGVQPRPRRLASHPHHGPARVPAPLRPRRRRRHRGVATHAGQEGAGRRPGQGRVGRQARSTSSARCAATARWAARSTRWSRTASGCARSRCSIRPINLGAHCAKGAALREHGHGEFRLKYPMKLVDGKYQRISWDQALDEISAKMLELRKQSGPDSVFVVGSSQAQQRAGLPAAQVDVALGQQQHRPPGAHLPQHHGGRRREHLGLRCDDQLVQRHAERQGGAVHRRRTPPRRTRCRCCTCCTPRRTAAR